VQAPQAGEFSRSAWSEVLSLFTLPYRIWRYFQYDRPYPSQRLTSFYTGSALKKQKELLKWIRGAADFPVKLQVPDSSNPAGGGGPLVAVLDSGVDYLHPGISPSIVGMNLGAQEKIHPAEQVGWDFVSMDPRPFDDHYHGTQVASLVAAVAPQAQLLPIKVFSPYGTTSSAALYSGFKYALRRGAKIIVCAWGSAVQSATLKQAILEAKKQGSLGGGAAFKQRSQRVSCALCFF
jgi:subtilisin family serine protease